ncbi:MAG: DNA polymerase [Candidatus Heimdallarchaeaceae archaeon]
MRCKECPLNGRPKVPGVGTKKDFVVVGEAPGQMEAKLGKPFVGKAGQILRMTLQEAGIKPESIWITNACLCHPPGNATPDSLAIECCRDRLFEEIRGCKKLLLVGAIAAQSVAPERLPITTNRGRVFWIEELQAHAIITWHPAKILRVPIDFTDFAKDVKKIVDFDSENVIEHKIPEIKVCRNIMDVLEMIEDVKRDGRFVCDIETTDLNPLVGEILLIGIQSRKEKCYQIPGELLRNKFVVSKLKELFESPIISGGQNVSFDAKFLNYKLGIQWEPQIDTMLAHYTLDERRGGHRLEEIARDYYDAPDYTLPVKQFLRDLRAERLKEIRLAKKSNLEPPEYVEPNYKDLPFEMLSKYNALDTYYTLLLSQDLVRDMEKDEVRDVHDKILVPASLALSQIELVGVRLDIEYLASLQNQINQQLGSILLKLQEVAGPKFNPNSPKQVSEFLYGKLRLKGTSTNKRALRQMADQHEAVKLILEYRKLQTLKGTFVEGLLSKVSPDSRVHADFLLHGTVTGRLSSRNPNLQNIPALVGPLIRDAFVATPGWVLVEADYSQLELRCATYYSGDELLTKYYKEDKDVHRMVASEVFNIPAEKVTERQRHVAKFIDFGIIYGRGAKSLAFGELKCSVAEAQRYIDSFLSRFRGLAGWMEEVRNQAITQGYVTTPFGRKRRFPIILNSNKGEILRQAVNAPIQSMASDLCLTALVRLHNRFNPDEARILLTVHDSILIEVKPDKVDEVISVVKYEMEENCPIDSPIPFKIGINIGERWGSLDKRNK